MKNTKKAFTLIELLTVIGIVALLVAILIPSLAAAKERSKIVVVNAELSNLGLALETYAMDNEGKYPPTRFDCNDASLKHFWAIPQELVETKILKGGQEGYVKYADFCDPFNSGLAYKYVTPGPMYSYFGDQMTLRLQVPNGFPNTEVGGYIRYSDQKASPVTWIAFSVGPRFSIETSYETGFPVSRRFWYSPSKKKGLIVRARLRNGKYIGTFEGRP